MLRLASPFRLHRLGAAGLVALVATVAVGQPTPPLPEAETAESILASHPAEVRAQLERDGLVMLSGSSPDGYIRALVRFEQPRRRALRLLSQTARHKEFRPELEHIESNGWSEEVAIDTHRMRIMFMNIDYRLRTHFDWQHGRIWWELDPEFDNGLEAVEGFWELFELDPQRTLGRFGTKVSVGPNLPEWLQDAATRKNVPQAMENVRRWIDSDGTFRP